MGGREGASINYTFEPSGHWTTNVCCSITRPLSPGWKRQSSSRLVGSVSRRFPALITSQGLVRKQAHPAEAGDNRLPFLFGEKVTELIGSGYKIRLLGRRRLGGTLLGLGPGETTYLQPRFGLRVEPTEVDESLHQSRIALVPERAAHDGVRLGDVVGLAEGDRVPVGIREKRVAV